MSSGLIQPSGCWLLTSQWAIWGVLKHKTVSCRSVFNGWPFCCSRLLSRHWLPLVLFLCSPMGFTALQLGPPWLQIPLLCRYVCTSLPLCPEIGLSAWRCVVMPTILLVANSKHLGHHSPFVMVVYSSLKLPITANECNFLWSFLSTFILTLLECCHSDHAVIPDSLFTTCTVFSNLST